MSDDTETRWQVVGHEGCESEPIHTPNAIQARGWLLAFDRVQGLVTHVSSNLAVAAAEMPNTPSVLGAALEDVVHGLELPAAASQLGDIDEWHTTMPWLTADAVMLTAHSTDDHYVIEIECDVASVAADSTEMIARLLAAPNWQAFADETVAALSQTFGYARTMVYTFHADHHGEVTAEHLDEPPGNRSSGCTTSPQTFRSKPARCTCGNSYASSTTSTGRRWTCSERHPTTRPCAPST